MDKLINAHVDKIEALEEKLNAIIDEETAKIDIDEVIASPQTTLSVVAERIKRIFLDEYAHEAIELGFDFGRTIKKRIEQDKVIKIDDSNNPNLNDTGQGNKQD